MEDYREIGPPGNGKTRKTGASNLAAVRETTRPVRIHASRVIFRGALKIVCGDEYQARRALKELCVALREIGLSVNSKKTEICAGAATDQINENLDTGSPQIERIDTLWKTKTLGPISRSFPELRTYALELLNEGRLESREFRFCINRLSLLASCAEFEVPAGYFEDITLPIRLSPTPTICSVSPWTAGKGRRRRIEEAIRLILDCSENRTGV